MMIRLLLMCALALALPVQAAAQIQTFQTIRITSTAADALCVGGSGSAPSSCTGGIKSGPIVATTLDLNTNGLAWGDVNKSGSSLADLATRAVANLSDGSNVALLNTANAFTEVNSFTVNALPVVMIAAPNATGTAIRYNQTTVGSGQYNWQVGMNMTVANTFEWIPSTAAGGSTFSTPVMTLSRAGILTLTGAFQLGGNMLNPSGNIMDSTGTPTVTSGGSAIAGRDYAFKYTHTSMGTPAVLAFGNTWSTTPVCTTTSDQALYGTYISAVSTASVSVGFLNATAGSPTVYVHCRSY